MKQFVLTLTIVSFGTAWAGERMSLYDYLKEVEIQNLTLEAYRASVDAAEARAAGVALPEPTVAFMQMKDSSGSANGYQIEQTIPFPSKLTSDRKARSLEAQAESANASSIKKEILAQARLHYVSAWAAQSRVQFLNEKRNALQEHLKLSQASARSDASLKIHTLKAESDLDLLENEVLEAEQSLKEKLSSLAVFAKKDPAQYRPEVSEPPMSDIPSSSSMAHPSQLEFKRLNFEMFEARESEAKSSWFPDFNLRYKDIGGTPLTAGYNEVMVGVTVPLFFWEPNAKSKAATAEKVRAEAEYHQEKLNLEAKITSLSSRVESLKKQLDVIQNKLLPRAEKRMRLVHNLAPRDMESISDHREAMEAFPDLKLKALDLRLQYEEAISQLSALTSETQP